ncbi:YdcF family protein [Camelliibacillus cellulosilyticus]|uniref:YdcF family protein n=1 Tax=Camelliibacillus cellulosilyticus TaxID=2174486 RepID=A0ABV9GJ53_9BACL
MLISEINPDSLSIYEMTQFIFGGIEDDGMLGDCIFVFGGKSTNRVKKAAHLFKSGRAPYILLTGGNSRWEKPEPEAIWMRDLLLKEGIPKEKMLLESKAANTTENVVASLFVLQKKFSLHRIKRLLVVSSPYHMRRCALTLKTYMPNWISYTFCPDDRPYGQFYNWWKADKEKEYVMKEAHALVKYVRSGILSDEDIDLATSSLKFR